MKKRYIYVISVLAMLLSLSSCHKEADLNDAGQEPAKVTGVLTRNGSIGLPPTIPYAIELTAKLSGVNYFNNVPSTMAAPSGQITFNSGSWYYPIGNAALAFYGFTPPAVGDMMSLTSGQTTANDALLSCNNGAGTPGSASSQITQLAFNHVMTKLDVLITTDDPNLDEWSPSTFNFTMSGVAASGSYPITSPDGTSAVNLSGSYQIGLGTNYLVPTGATLPNVLSSLHIDDYVATPADLTSFIINPLNISSSTIKLDPGKAYTLTFNIRRLKLQSMSITMGSWTNVYIADDAVQFVTESLTLDLGDYESDDVNKIEVIDNSGNMYIGRVSEGYAIFNQIPTSATTVSLYTECGLLITTTQGISITPTSLSIDYLNIFGMQPVSVTDPYTPVNPYAVSTAVQFGKINNTVPPYHYRQMANLSFDNIPMSSVNMDGWYDGNGFQINDINILGSGLFNAVDFGRVVQNVNIGSGVITQSGTSVGSICGTNNGEISGCINRALIRATSMAHVGGICGTNNGRISACLNTGNINGVYIAGSWMGGICGYNTHTSHNALEACVNIGMVSATGTYISGMIGGICGGAISASRFITCYWLTGTASAPTIGSPEVAVNGTGLTLIDQANLSPQRMSAATTINNLNAAIPLPWSASYNFTIAHASWPTPVKL